MIFTSRDSRQAPHVGFLEHNVCFSSCVNSRNGRLSGRSKAFNNSPFSFEKVAVIF